MDLVGWSDLLLVTLVLIVLAWLFKLRAEKNRAQTTIQTLEAQLVSSRTTTQAEREREFFLRFAREFPHMTRELQIEEQARTIPPALSKILIRSYDPWQALVLLRRWKVGSEEGRDQHFVIAAIARPESVLRIGMEVPMDQGELGLAAKTQQVLSRDDFTKIAPHIRGQLKRESIPGFEPDLVAPMVFRGETLGLLALSRPNLYTESAKAVLRVVAHMGALALSHATAYSEMKVTAEIDGLTGLYNKTHTSVTLAEKILESEQLGTPLSILLLDIDNFKNYNDTNGHDAGDHLLKKFAQVVADNIRSNSVFGRFGGEEFLLILPGAESAQALKAAENVRRRIVSHDFPYADRQPLGVLSFSGGVATYPGDGLESADLIRAADKALYAAKRAGRNRVLPAETQHIGEEALEPDSSQLASALEREVGRDGR